MPLIVLVAAYLPPLIWLWFFYSRDTYDREPRQLLLNLFLLGLGASVPAFALGGALGSLSITLPAELPPDAPDQPLLGGQLITVTAAVVVTAVVVGLIQELMKAAFAWSRIRHDKVFNEPVDGMIYFASVALGFAAAVNASQFAQGVFAVAVFPQDQAAEAAAQIGTMAVGGFITSLAHASFSGIAGYFVSRVVLGGSSIATAAVGIAIAVGLNALYRIAETYGLSLAADVTSPLTWLPKVIVVAVSVLVFAYLFRRALSDSPFRRGRLMREATSEPAT